MRGLNVSKVDVLAGLRKKPVAVTVGDVTVHVKPLTVGQKESFAAWRKDNPGPVGVVGKLIAASLCDESGALLLGSPDEVADLDGGLCEVLCDKIAELNGMKAKAEGDGPNS
jgi:hypothetical protein